jgi:hypothetical protein
MKLVFHTLLFERPQKTEYKMCQDKVVEIIVCLGGNLNYL